MSTSKMRFSATAKEAAKLTAVVVLPTPPFWFATAMTRPMSVVAPAAGCPLLTPTQVIFQ